MSFFTDIKQVKPTAVAWPSLLIDLEKNVMNGRHTDVKKLIHSFPVKQIPRQHVWQLAEMAWRISEPLLTLKLLNQFIFPKNSLLEGPSDKEKFIYATALANLGAINEAIQIFETIDPKKEPEVFLRKSLAYFRAWDYAAAIPNLKKFLSSLNLTEYRRTIGKVNLIAAYITLENYQDAKEVLEDVKNECIKNNYTLLLGNCFELESQIYFFSKKYDSALSSAAQALNLLKDQGGDFLLFAEKWNVIIKLFQNRSFENRVALKQFRQKAEKLNQSETVRDCDLFESIISEDADLFRKVIMGTPFEGYRDRARRLFGKKFIPQGKFHLLLGLKDNGSNSVFVFSPYELQNGNESLHQKPQLLALFKALSLDFYKPCHIGFLFQNIYKDEKFNPFSSPKRVLNLIKRLDQWFIDQKVPLRVQMKKSEFSIIPLTNASVQILIQRSKPISKQNGYMNGLRKHFKDKTFSSQLVSKKLNISKSSAQTLINQGIIDDFITKQGTGRGISYLLVQRSKRKSAA